MKKNIYIQPVVEVMPICAISKVCAESFFEQMNIGAPADASTGR